MITNFTVYFNCIVLYINSMQSKHFFFFFSFSAEKKIMNAASKLAAMAKVLETPAPNRKCNRKDVVTGVY